MRAWVLGLNRLLPEDLAVASADQVPDDFDPRRWARGKRYVYRIWNGPARSPLNRLQAWQIYSPLDVEAMSLAASFLIGEHDFSSFQAAGCAAETTVRVIEDLCVAGRSGGEISIDVTASAFLRHMARAIAGTLVDVGRGKRAAAEMPDILAARDRRAAGRTAPARGLTLEEVYYGPRPPRRRLMAARTGGRKKEEGG